MSLFKFKLNYLLWSVFFFLSEVLIAVYAHDPFIRPYFGDTLAVLWLYSTIRAFIDWNTQKTALIVLLISYVIETLQYFHFINFLGLKDELWAQLILGTSFSWWDMFCYTIGYLLIVMSESMASRRT